MNLLVEGLFEIAPLPYKQPSGVAYRVVLICRAGRLFGADPAGRVYTGVLQANPKQALKRSYLKVVGEAPYRRAGPGRACLHAVALRP